MKSNQRAKVMVRRPRQNSKQGAAARSRSTLIPHPNQLGNYEVQHQQSLRFTAAAAAGTTAITYLDLLDTICIATSAIAPYDLFNGVRIRRVRLWAIAAIGTPATVTVRFPSNSAGFDGDFRTHTDTSMGIEPAYVSAVPARRAPASLWQGPSNSTAFTITCPAGTVVDVDLDFRNIPGSALAAQNASVGATVGSVFYRGLDGLAIAATNFVPPTGISQF